ncbi:MAG: hypothetical protein CMB56_001555 [Methanobacteriota archaeon]|nr:MAG: hypothetical protein CMB56_001555 [Euryarchaeota archaeon]|tara:strand:+ start:615 stop:1256 length:642 start_codon:yes stop_codon:yes gene_type:complete
MGETEREAKAKLRTASEDLDELIRLFSENLKQSKEIFRNQLNELRKSAELFLNNFSLNREQIILELNQNEKKLNKLARQISKKKYDTNAAADQLIEIATTHGKIKGDFIQKRNELELSMNDWLKFTDAVSDILTLIHSKSSEWEKNARDLGISYQEIADTSIPSEFQKNRKIILEYSISILLSAGKREQNDMMSFEGQLKDLMDKTANEEVNP